MKILILGYCPQRFLNPIVKELNLRGHRIDLISFKNFDIPKAESKYYNSIQNGLESKNIFFRLISILHASFSADHSQMLKNLGSLKQLSVFQKLKLYLKSLSNFETGIKLANCDLLNIQLLGDLDSWFLYMKPNVKLMVSFWGTDLLKADEAALAKQRKWLIKSNLITVQSKELKSILLEKHSKTIKDQSDKIKQILFPINQDILDQIQKIKAKRRAAKKLMITIAYNSSENQNHLEIIAQLDLLPEDIKDQISIYLPLSYGGTRAYQKQLVSRLQSSSLEIEFNTNFETDNQVAQRRVDTDIFIHLPSTDAFCAALTEALLAENIVITGDWLPYDLYKAHNIKTINIAEISELNKAMIHCVNNITQIKEQLKDNPARVLKLVDQKTLVKQWVENFEQL